jgi:hypothetical protein
MASKLAGPVASLLLVVSLLPVTAVLAGQPAGGLSPGPDWSSLAYDELSCTASAGDLNGDDYPDVVLAGLRYQGLANVYYGGPNGPSDAPDWVGGFAVFAAAGAGDVNGDGLDDLITGGYKHLPAGRVAVHFGSPSGLGPAPDWRQVCDQEDAQYGYAVAPAGDVNGDGYADVVVGAPYYVGGTGEQGRAFVYHGSPTGPGRQADWTADGELAHGRFGYSVAGAGDVNGDGYDDVIVGARAESWESDPARAYLFLGSPSGLSPTPTWFVEHDAGTAFGASVDSAGDVNGDGYADLVVGAPYDNAGANTGAAYVYHGSPDGPETTASWSAFGVYGDAVLGGSVSGAGDVNGDSFADVIVGSPSANRGTNRDGRVFVYLGSPAGLSQVPDWIGRGWGGYGYTVAGAHDSNRDGRDDVLIGSFPKKPGLNSHAYLYLGGDQDLAMFVDDIDLAWRQDAEGYRLRVVASVEREGSAEVAGAHVTVSLSEEGGGSQSMTRATDPKGRATFLLVDADGGTWEVCVTDIARDGYYYDPAQNNETCDTISFP